MNKEELIKLLRSTFPQAIGAMLTGSQFNKTHFNTISDVDVVVFDRTTSDVHTRGLRFQQNKIDCTIVPVFDIENVVLNEFYDPKGIIIYMISSGEILYDTNTIIEDIASAVLPLKNKISERVKTNYHQSVEQLLKMSKYFERELSESERILLACDFIYCITKIEAIRCNGWDFTSLHKARLLNEHNSAFVTDILQLHRMVVETKDLRFLHSYVKQYQNKLGHFDDTLQQIITFDIAIPDFSLQYFHKDILPVILSNSSLYKCYLYSFISPRKYHRLYRHDIAISFAADKGMAIIDIIHELLECFKLLENANSFQYEIVHQLRENTLGSLENQLLNLRIHLSALVKVIMQQQTNTNTFETALALCTYLQHLLGLDMETLCFLNTFLMQRWLLTHTEQKNAKEHHLLNTLGKEKQQKWDLQYNNTKNHLTAIMRTSIAGGISVTPEVNICYQQVIDNLKIIFFDNEADFITSYFPDSLLHSIQVSEMRESRAYLLLAEEILQLLNLNDSVKAQCLYFMSKGTVELFFS